MEKPRGKELLHILDNNPLMGANALKKLPNESMRGFSIRQEAQRIERDLATYSRFAGED